MNVKRSCFLALVVWLALGGVYGYLAWTRTRETTPAVLIGLLGGTFAAILVGGLGGLIQALRDRAAIRRAESGFLPADGARGAASGAVRPLGPPLRAPFTGREAVAYEYDVKRPAQGEDGPSGSDYAGVWLTPCVVEAPAGPAKLLGLGILDQFRQRTITSEEDLARGRDYLARATFEELKLASALRQVSELMTDEDGEIKKDLRMATATGEISGRLVTERIVAVGEPVTVIGTWDAARHGFTGVRLFPGGGDLIRRKVLVDAVKGLGIGLFFFLALHAFLVPMWILSKRSGADAGASAKATLLDVRDCGALRAGLAAKANPNERGPEGRTPLMDAARYGLAECLPELLAAGARVDLADEAGRTAYHHAVFADRDDVARLLRKSGAVEFRATAENGSPIEPDHPALTLVSEYLAAIQQGDTAAVGRLSQPSVTTLLDGDPSILKLWKDTRPAKATVLEGFARGDLATITIPSAVAGQLLHYQVEKKDGAWHLAWEWFTEERGPAR